MATAWALDERLVNDCLAIGDLPLCRVLLMRDARFPWVIIVPRLAGATQMHALPPADRHVLMEEISTASAALQQLTGAENMNVAALGNIVEQLHVHIIARFATDAAWPRPVWGVGAPAPYGPGEAEARAATIADALGL